MTGLTSRPNLYLALFPNLSVIAFTVAGEKLPYSPTTFACFSNVSASLQIPSHCICLTAPYTFGSAIIESAKANAVDVNGSSGYSDVIYALADSGVLIS